MMTGFGVGAYHYERNMLELAENGCQVGLELWPGDTSFTVYVLDVQRRAWLMRAALPHCALPPGIRC